MITKHGKVKTHHKNLSPKNSYNPLDMFLERLCHKLKTLYVHYHEACGHKTYQGDDIQQEAPTHQFTWSINEAILRVHGTNEIHFDAEIRKPIVTKLGKALTYSERLPFLNPYSLLTIWFKW